MRVEGVDNPAISGYTIGVSTRVGIPAMARGGEMMKTVDEQIEIASQLEAIVGRHGLSAVVWGLADVAYNQGSQRWYEWRDHSHAETWEQAGSVIARAASSVKRLGL